MVPVNVAEKVRLPPMKPTAAAGVVSVTMIGALGSRTLTVATSPVVVPVPFDASKR